MTTPPCEVLPWDSAFFGKKIARITDTRVDSASFANICEWAGHNSVDCLYFLSPADGLESIHAAEKAGFRMVDIRVTLELRPIRQCSAATDVRFATISDVPALRAIAGVSHYDSRFYSDPHFSRERCDELYKIWIEKAVLNSEDAVVVVGDKDQVKGYCSCHLRGSGMGNIGLVGLASEAQGRGLGGTLLDGAFHWFQEKECQEVTVVTQARNIRAMRFYQKAGFLTRSVEVWLHRWFTAN